MNRIRVNMGNVSQEAKEDTLALLSRMATGDSPSGQAKQSPGQRRVPAQREKPQSAAAPAAQRPVQKYHLATLPEDGPHTAASLDMSTAQLRPLRLKLKCNPRAYATVDADAGREDTGRQTELPPPTEGAPAKDPRAKTVDTLPLWLQARLLSGSLVLH